MKEVLEAKKLRVARGRYGLGEDLRLPVDVFHRLLTPNAQ